MSGNISSQKTILVTFKKLYRLVSPCDWSLAIDVCTFLIIFFVAIEKFFFDFVSHFWRKMFHCYYSSCKLFVREVENAPSVHNYNSYNLANLNLWIQRFKQINIKRNSGYTFVVWWSIIGVIFAVDFIDLTGLCRLFFVMFYTFYWDFCSDPSWGGRNYILNWVFFCSVNFGRSIYSS